MHVSTILDQEPLPKCFPPLHGNGQVAITCARSLEHLPEVHVVMAHVHCLGGAEGKRSVRKGESRGIVGE
jgi:hypothetical protein